MEKSTKSTTLSNKLVQVRWGMVDNPHCENIVCIFHPSRNSSHKRIEKRGTLKFHPCHPIIITNCLTMEKSSNSVFCLFAFIIASALVLILAYICQKCKKQQLFTSFQDGQNETNTKFSNMCQKNSRCIQKSVYGSIYDPNRSTNYYSSISFTP